MNHLQQFFDNHGILLAIFKIDQNVKSFDSAYKYVNFIIREQYRQTDSFY